MKRLRTLPIVVITLGISAILISACSVASAAGPEAEANTMGIPNPIQNIEIVVESRLAPREAVELSFVSSGEVNEILVAEGDQVKAGDVLARLGNQEALEATITNADLELYNAQQDLDKLYEDVEITRAETLAVISAANRAVRDAQYQLDNYTVRSNQADMSAIEAVETTEANLDQAREAFEPYKNKSNNDAPRKQLKEDLDNAQSDYNAAVRRLEYEVELVEAKAQLEKAKHDYGALEDGPNPSDIRAAELRITAAETALKAAKAALNNLELKASINGTVVDMDLIEGAQISAGQPVVSVADLSSWYVETDDLTEIDVVDVHVGQKATIAVDALPGLEMSGTVETISQVFEEKRGDITYTVRILVDEADPRLRWGMTMAVTFVEEQEN